MNCPNLTNTPISIAIPTYRRHNLLDRALRSILSNEALHGIIVRVYSNDFTDALSREVTETIAPHFQARGATLNYIAHPQNVGMAGNWNACIAQAPTPWVCLLHDDDELCPNYIHTMQRAIPGVHERTIVIAGANHYINSTGHIVSAPRRIFAPRHETICRVSRLQLIAGLPINNAGWLINVRNFAAVGKFDHTWHPIFDYEFLWRSHCLRYNIYKVSTTVARYRIDTGDSLRDETKLGFVRREADLFKNIRGAEKTLRNLRINWLEQQHKISANSPSRRFLASAYKIVHHSINLSNLFSAKKLPHSGQRSNGLDTIPQAEQTGCHS